MKVHYMKSVGGHGTDIIVSQQDSRWTFLLQYDHVHHSRPVLSCYNYYVDVEKSAGQLLN